MIGKVCRTPAGGGSAQGNVRYILGYALGAKEDAVQARTDFHAAMEEADLRPDFGVGNVWHPAAGKGIRPSAIYAHAVTALSTADLEMSATASANPRVREQTVHLVFSLQQSVERSDEEMISGVRETLDRYGVGHHQYVIALHRDTADTHAHVALSAVDPKTYRAMDRWHIQERLHRAMRETEVSRGWEHDHGFYVVRDAGLETQRIEKASWRDRELWERDRDDRRLERLEIKKQYLDESFAEKADKTIAPRLQMTLDTLRERGERVDFGELHLTAARYGARLEIEEIADVVKGEDQPRSRKIVLVSNTPEHEGERVDLSTVLRDDLADLNAYRTSAEAEADLIAAIEADPNLPARRIGAEKSTFDRNDYVRYLDDRLSDVATVESLADFVERRANVRVVSADTRTPLYAYEPQALIEDRLAETARTLANAKDARFDSKHLDKAVAKVERDLNGRLSDEQRAILSHLDRRMLVAEGDPGTGKTFALRVAKEYADIQHREIVGLATSNAASRTLESESGIKCYNNAKGIKLEQLGEQVIPENGFVILEEAGMDDSKTAENLLRTCKERNATAIVIGDTKQLQPILAGQALRILRSESREAATYETLTGILRQRNDWHREVVHDLADGLRAIQTTGSVDESKVRKAIETIEQHGAFEPSENLETMIDAAARSYVIDRKMGIEAVYMAASKETQRYANEAIRERLGLAGIGVVHVTRYGRRTFAVGDTVVLRENHSRLRIVNGDTATVQKATPTYLDLHLQDGRQIRIWTARYDAVDFGYVQTYHASQGKSVERSVMLLDRAASAELFFVGVSRSKESLQILYAQDSFESTSDIADHVASRSSLKTTSQNFEELLSRPDLTRQKMIEDILASDNHPLRQKYDLIEEEKRDRRDEQVRSLHARYAERRRDISCNGDLSLEQRLNAGKEMERDHRRDVRAVIEAYKPVQFGRFVHDEVQARQAAREIEQREAKRSREQARGRDLPRERIQLDNITHTREREREIEHGIER